MRVTWYRVLGLAVACAATCGAASAQTTSTVGAGSAVTRVDRAADFDSLTQNGISLSDYTEGLLFVGVDGDSEVDFDPFHGADGASPTFQYPLGGSYGWVVVQTTDAKAIRAVEFVYGNGWTTGDSTWPWGNDLAYVDWETYVGNTLVSSGTIGGSGLVLEMGTVLGFVDPTGFDRLQLRCKISTSFDPDLQALALDGLHVQLVAPPASWSNYGTGWAGTLGVPSLVAESNPVVGQPISIDVGNSAGVATIGVLAVGAASASKPTALGGTLLVDAYAWTIFALPSTGYVFADTIPDDPALDGVDFYLQALEADGGASRHVAFSAGLDLLLGTS
jgi:hypothetical protein